MSTERPKSELEQGLDALSRAVNGLGGRILGPKAVGRESLPETPAISPEVDEAVERAADSVGRFLNATGEALKRHPLEPVEAVKDAQAHQDEPVETPPGWSPLAGGLKTLGEGVMSVAEGVLDTVAPKKPKP